MAGDQAMVGVRGCLVANRASSSQLTGLPEVPRWLTTMSRRNEIFAVGVVAIASREHGHSPGTESLPLTETAPRLASRGLPLESQFLM